MSKFYGIGVGIGDPEMITIKAVNTLKKLDVLIVPNAGRDFESTALEIAKEYVKEDIEIKEIEFSMTPNITRRQEERRENAKIVEEYLRENKNVGFITIGDPMTYSTYVYLLENISKDYMIETVPGISSFADISSRVNLPLVMGDETLKILPLSKKITEDMIEKEILNSDNLVVMKASLKFEELKSAIIKTKNEDNIVLISEAGKKEERVYFNLDEIEGELPYFSTLILKKGGVAEWKRSIS